MEISLITPSAGSQIGGYHYAEERVGGGESSTEGRAEFKGHISLP